MDGVRGKGEGGRGKGEGKVAASPLLSLQIPTRFPYKRIGEASEIGRAAVWLTSDDSDYPVGTTRYIDGGMTLYPGFETGR